MFWSNSGVKCPILTIMRDKCSSLMIIKMGHFTPEWAQNFVCCVHGLLLKFWIILCGRKTLYVVVNKSDCSQHFEKKSCCPQNFAFYHRLGPRPCIYMNQNPVSEFIKILHKHNAPHFWKWDRFFLWLEDA